MPVKTDVTTTCVTPPIVAALTKTEDILGPDREWNAVNALQKTFVADYLPDAREVALIPEIESIASEKTEDINAFLAARGFQIKLDPLVPTPNERPFATASVMDVLVEWVEDGDVTHVTTPDGEEYAAVRIKRSGAEFYDADGLNGTIVGLKTKSGDRVYLAMMQSPGEGFDLVAKAMHLSKTKKYFSQFAAVVFPKVDLDQKVDISWLKKLWTIDSHGCHAKITQALQQTKFKMNEKGARAKSAVALGGMRSTSIELPPIDLIINKPFLLWIERDGLTKPLFVGYLCQDVWKDPGSLNM